MKFQISHHKLMIENGRYVQTVGNSFTREGAALFCYLVTLLDQLVVANSRERVCFGFALGCLFIKLTSCLA